MSPLEDEWIDFDDCTCLKTTNQAVLVIGIKPKPMWIPKSCLGKASELENEGDTGLVVVNHWFAKKEGLI